MKSMDNDLISIVMLSRNNGQHVEECIKSVQAQTHKNWELLFVDDQSTDNTISLVSKFKEEDDRIHLSQSVFYRGQGTSRLSALRGIRGKWLAFLDTGDIWEPEKLERQLNFMKTHNYSFSYTYYKQNDEKNGEEYMVKGPEVITYKEMKKCCWPAYLTVMCNADLVKLCQVEIENENNDYALWLLLSKMSNCYLLNECLAKNMTRRTYLEPLSLLNKIKWRFEVYNQVLKFNPLSSTYMTLRNIFYTIVKNKRYVKRIII